MKNILVIICDQLRKDCLGCYGNPYIRTPNIDRLAKKSVVCEQNYVANPICMPNRLSIFSGLYPRNHGLWTNGLLIPDEDATVMHHLKQQGYQTASIGKVHFEPGGSSYESGSRESDVWWDEAPEQADRFHGPYWGFDYIELHDNHHLPSGHMKRWFAEQGGTEAMFQVNHRCDDHESGTIPLPPSLHSSAFVSERTVHYLEELRKPDQPFFLVASFTDPHHPFVAPEQSYDRLQGCSYKPPVGAPEDLETRPAHYRQHLDGAWGRKGIGQPKHPGGISDAAAYERTRNTYAMVELIDSNVGRILDSLDQQKLWKDTVVMFTSDHGDLLGDFGLWHKGPFFFDGLVNTPLLIAAPGVSPTESSSLMSAVDLVPTLCELVDVPVPFYVDGVSQVSVLCGKQTSARESCLIEYRNGYGINDRNSKVLLTEGYKLAVYQDGVVELTDRKADPQERVNVAHQPDYLQIQQSLTEQLLFALLCTESKRPEQLSHA